MNPVMKTRIIATAKTVGCVCAPAWAVAWALTLAASLVCSGADARQPLWQIGQAYNRAAEFALAPTNFPQFLLRFGSPDRAYYVGLSKPESDWPYVLPGPMDPWAGSSDNGRWECRRHN